MVADITTEQLCIYRLGFRLKQAMILHDVAAKKRTRSNVELYGTALVELDRAFSAFSRSCGISEAIVEQGELLIFNAYRLGELSLLQPPAESNCWTPSFDAVSQLASLLQQALQTCLHVSKAGTWYNLGLAVTWAIPRGRANGCASHWPPELLEPCNELGIDVEDLTAPHRGPGPTHPEQWSSWHDIEEGLRELENTVGEGSTPSQIGPSRLREYLSESVSIPSADKRVFQRSGRPEKEGTASASSVGSQEPLHDPDFRWVNWYGTEYEFSFNQGLCVQVLWEHAERGILALTQERIFERAGMEPGRLRDVFKVDGSRMHPAWKTMITPKGKGLFGLSHPVPRQSANSV
jgi:hypothetical protein